MDRISEEVQQLDEAARRASDPEDADFKAERKPWPEIGNFTLDRASDPYNPSNRSGSLKRRSSDR